MARSAVGFEIGRDIGLPRRRPEVSGSDRDAPPIRRWPKRNDTLPRATASWLISISKIFRASPSLWTAAIARRSLGWTHPNRPSDVPHISSCSMAYSPISGPIGRLFRILLMVSRDNTCDHVCEALVNANLSSFNMHNRPYHSSFSGGPHDR
jgi:hypothetical protein